MAWRIGVDSGGTFTDVCLFNDITGEVTIWKVSSTPDDPSRGITQGVTEGLERVEATAAELSFLGHGTTVATNALIQGRGVKTGLITTDGFRDLLEIGRQKRPDLYDLQADKPETLVPRDLRLGVRERLTQDGSVEEALDEDAFREAVRELKAQGVKSVAVSFLYSFLNDAHERRAAAIIRDEFPEAFTAISSAIAPEFREFERLSTTVVNAYLGPVMQGYVRALKRKLEEIGLKVPPQLTQSNGGVIAFDTAAENPVRTVLSGPSTGVVAAQAIGAMTGIADLITFDMGGTSSDVALLTNGRCRIVNESVVHGYPLKVPMLDIHTVGAGGGSIAYVDNGGLLKVGPRSAGANPGPACYGLGNEEPTVTDANVVLQTQNPEYLLNGRMKIDRQLSVNAVQKLADRLGLGMLETANGILDIVIANMAKAIRVISVQRGYDPRDYTLVAFGGAGPVQAARLARELGMTRVLIPRTPGVLCAMGLLMTDLRSDFSATSLTRLDQATTQDIAGIYDDLAQRAEAWFNTERINAGARVLERSVDVRYAGQNYEISVPVPEGRITAETFKAIEAGFVAAHRQLYGFIAEGEPMQLVTFRMAASGLVTKAEFKPQEIEGVDSAHAVTGARPVWMVEVRDFVETKLYDRALLRAGNVVEGPAIIDQMDSTTVVPPGQTATVDAYLNLILEAK
ncbi:MULTISPECIES: hydantoinase/oxoprolinase family protein [unclassified Chelatococcus]|uniref:hydantoinase/oxoprolinase family protein n=1 Tax=unclassified Chelatococcus TaxID=2638111 RepID=UPI001BCFDBCE|nr:MULTISPECIES: hydantoinase/oxoprolinase family protein [unclassified Chelatococcus]MBS7699904.1 hydantoinase/oxoprolinase family protein [Chelatococcus sp. YT9]MBX3558750.1 hydantoinase/oxoprolinase family protein [Chelatococcus sp.]